MLPIETSSESRLSARAHTGVRARYAAKLTSNLFGALAGLILMIVVPRALGPASFGRFEFSTTSLLEILNVISLSFPIAFFNWVSRGDIRRANTGLVAAVFFSLVVFVLLLVIIEAAVLLGINGEIWPEVPVAVLWWAFVFAASSFSFQIIGMFADGTAQTIRLETVRACQTVLRTLAIVALYALGALSIENFFIAQIVTTVGAILILAWILIRAGSISKVAVLIEEVDSAALREFFRSSFSFIRPLIFYSMVSWGFGFFDRWILQGVSGSSQQGFYSLAMKISGLAFLFTSSMTPVITREFAAAHARHDMDRLRSLFDKIKIFVFLAACIGGSMCINARTILQIFGGTQYEEAYWAFMLMALYPIHQTFGQLSNALYFATGSTRLYGQIGILGIIVGTPVTYFLVAKKSSLLPGLELGSMGLALKMVLVQAVLTNVFLFFNTRSLSVRYAPWLWFQLRAIGIPLLGAWMARRVALSIDVGTPTRLLETLGHPISGEQAAMIVFLVVSSGVFAILVGAIVLFTPKVVGLDPKLIRDMWTKVWRQNQS